LEQYGLSKIPTEGIPANSGQAVKNSGKILENCGREGSFRKEQP
jgi:hypothetical protein